MTIDSTDETLKHRGRVKDILTSICGLLIRRGLLHDQSKLEVPEKPLFDHMTPKLKSCTYASEQYKQYLAELKPALEHHYAENPHHPEHFEDGISGMTLLDVVEMFADWKAASERHADGDFGRSIEINAKRFEMDSQLVKIFKNTKKFLDL